MTFQKFFDNNYSSKFIKSLLRNIPLPKVPTISEGQYMIEGKFYLLNNTIVKCTTSGILATEHYDYYYSPNLLKIPSMNRGISWSKTSSSSTYGGMYYIRTGDSDNTFVKIHGNVPSETISICKFFLKKGTYTFYCPQLDYQSAMVMHADISKDAPTLDGNPPEQIVSTIQGSTMKTFTTDADGDFYLSVTFEYSSTRMNAPFNFAIYGGELKKSPEVVPYKEPISTYEIVSTYLFGDKDAELSDTFISENSYYDSETHKRLGEYLRCYRDLYGIDLMSMYNCFAYDILNGFYYNGEKIEKETNSSYKMVAIPIKFNRTYTVAIDCSTPYYIYPIFYGENGLTNIGIPTNNSPLTDRVIEQHGDEFATKVKGSRFNHPYTFNVSYESQTFKNRETVESDLSKNYENNLYMVLQLPSTNDSSIVVLEGDYTEVPSQNMCNEVGNLPVATQNNLMLGQVGLLQFNSKTTYAFSNKLMEYLLNNVVCPTDEITENIIRIQGKVGTLGEPFTVKGIYDPILRKRVYDKCIGAKDLRKYDINGYVDRDTEHYLFIREGGR